MADVVAGHPVRTQQEGAYVGRCAELCGTYHAFMNFEVRAVSPADFDAYMAARADGDSTFDALESIGQPGRATTTHPYDIGQRSQQASDG